MRTVKGGYGMPSQLSSQISSGGTHGGSAEEVFTITPSDTVNFDTVVRGVYVGGAGNVVAISPSGAVVAFTAVPAGTVLPIRAKRINSTSTTATAMVGLV